MFGKEAFNRVAAEQNETTRLGSSHYLLCALYVSSQTNAFWSCATTEGGAKSFAFRVVSGGLRSAGVMAQVHKEQRAALSGCRWSWKDVAYVSFSHRTRFSFWFGSSAIKRMGPDPHDICREAGTCV